MGLMVGLPEEDRNYGRDGSELSAKPSVMLLWHHGSSTVASYIGRERDRQTDRDRETERQTETEKDRDRQTDTDRQTDRLIKLYFSTVKILTQRPTHISAVATVLLIAKT